MVKVKNSNLHQFGNTLAEIKPESEIVCPRKKYRVSINVVAANWICVLMRKMAGVNVVDHILPARWVEAATTQTKVITMVMGATIRRGI